MLNIFKQQPHLLVVLFARLLFDTAADIDAVNSHLNSPHSVFGIYTTGQKYPLMDVVYHVPVEGFSRSTIAL